MPGISDAPLPQASPEVPEKDSPNDTDDEEPLNDDQVSNATSSKKKKKKKTKRKKLTLEQIRQRQTSPPTIPVSKLFQPSQYPLGEVEHYVGSNSYRTTSEEKRHLEILADQEELSSPHNYNSIRRGAEVHRQVRSFAKQQIKVGMGLTEIAELIENGVRTLVEYEPRVRGVAFPTGLSLNHCAAHFTPNFGDTTILQKGDVLKVDFGVHVNGRIIDSAFTLNFNDDYDNLLKAVKAATDAGVKEAGIDARLAELGAVIQETMESYEVEVGGKTIPVKAIRNLTGHDILPYQIHGGKSVPIVADSHEPGKMQEGEYYAIETFGSTGLGYVQEQGECSHYARNAGVNPVLRLAKAKTLLQTITTEFGTLPFCRRYLDRIGENPPDYYEALDNLVRRKVLTDYPPLCDAVGCKTAQFEHTILLRPTCKEVVSRGDDY